MMKLIRLTLIVIAKALTVIIVTIMIAVTILVRM